MSSKRPAIELQQRDRVILDVLTHRVRALTIAQVARSPPPPAPSGRRRRRQPQHTATAIIEAITLAERAQDRVQ